MAFAGGALIPGSGTHVHKFSDPGWFIGRSTKQALGAIVEGKRYEWRDACQRTRRIASLRRLICQDDRANDDPLHVELLRHMLGRRLVSNCGGKYPARYADRNAIGPGELASITQADTALHDESSDVRALAFGENIGDPDGHERSRREVLFRSDATQDNLHTVKSAGQAPWGKDIASDEGQPVGRRQSFRMASNGGNQVSLCKRMRYHSAPRRPRRSHNRYLHASTRIFISRPRYVPTLLAPITMIRRLVGAGAGAALRLTSLPNPGRHSTYACLWTPFLTPASCSLSPPAPVVAADRLR